MKKTCKIKPDRNVCYSCIDIQIDEGVVANCSDCNLLDTGYELLSVGSTFWKGDYAIVLKNGKIKSVPLHRVCDVKETIGGLNI